MNIKIYVIFFKLPSPILEVKGKNEGKTVKQGQKQSHSVKDWTWIHCNALQYPQCRGKPEKLDRRK